MYFPAPSPPSFFTVFDYTGTRFNSTWKPPKGAASYNIMVVPKASPEKNKTYSTTGEFSRRGETLN